MFDTISWQEFITTVALLAGSYYCVSAIILYRRELSAWLKSGEHQDLVPTAHPGTGRREDKDPSGDLMGKAQPDQWLNANENVELSEAGELRFGPSTREQETSENAMILGTVSDLLQEIRSLVEAVAGSNGGREEFVSMFRSLLERYPQLNGTSYKDTINVFICDTCKEHSPFELELKEIRSWWSPASRQKETTTKQ